MSNVTYSGMLGYRSGFNSDKYKFSSTGRDKNWGNLFAVFYQNGMIKYKINFLISQKFSNLKPGKT